MGRRLNRLLAVGGAMLAAVRGLADPTVVVSAVADPQYTARKFGGAQAAAESYVVMPGHYLGGDIADPSLARMPFRRIAEVFAPELAKRNYWPAKTVQQADLLIVVHWGTTAPPVSRMEMTARSNPLPDVTAARQDRQMRMQTAMEAGDAVGMLLAGLMHEEAQLIEMEQLERFTDQMAMDAAMARSAQLLGYTGTLRNLGQRWTSTAEEETLRGDLSQLRYFIILRAYDLHARTPAERSRAVWTLHLNVSSSGNNFQSALDHMGAVAANYVGRTTGTVESVRPVPPGKVTIGPLESHGEPK